MIALGFAVLVWQNYLAEKEKKRNEELYSAFAPASEHDPLLHTQHHPTSSLASLGEDITEHA